MMVSINNVIQPGGPGSVYVPPSYTAGVNAGGPRGNPFPGNPYPANSPAAGSPNNPAVQAYMQNYQQATAVNPYAYAMRQYGPPAPGLPSQGYANISPSIKSRYAAIARQRQMLMLGLQENTLRASNMPAKMVGVGDLRNTAPQAPPPIYSGGGGYGDGGGGGYGGGGGGGGGGYSSIPEWWQRMLMWNFG